MLQLNGAMSHSQLPPLPVVATSSELNELLEKIEIEKEIAVDIESNGFYVYHEKVCLLQLSTRKEDFIIDPISVEDLSPLKRIFADPATEKVFHAGDYDIGCLKRDYGFTVSNVFDTMIASRLLGTPKLGLAYAIEKYFGIHISKKLQRAHWGKRPLSTEQLQYARLDTHYLLRLRDILHQELRAP